MNNSFYRAFEDRFRGSRELIKERLIVYLPFAVALEEIYPDSKMVDIGCGRGEWLELLNEHGISALGVDQDVEMLKSCKELGLNFIVGDAFSYIKSSPDNSISILSAFHLVEHLDFNILQELIKESLRVLKPGGLIILETPNPENIAVGTKNFYIDPTHIRPVPQELLSFITEFYGFERTKVLRLQECEAVKDNTNLTIKDVIFGASQDYAIIAQKKSKVRISKLDELFEKKYGISTEDVALRYENKIERLIENVNFSIDDSKSFFELSLKKEIESNQETMIAKAQQSEAKVAEAEAKAQQSEAKVAEAEAKAQQSEITANSEYNKLKNELVQISQELQAILQANHHHFSLSEERGNQLKQVFSSRSWKITAPLRLINSKVSHLNNLGSKYIRSKVESKPELSPKNSIAQITEQTYLNSQSQRIFFDLKHKISGGRKKHN